MYQYFPGFMKYAIEVKKKKRERVKTGHKILR